jgi:hypothetical protein
MTAGGAGGLVLLRLVQVGHFSEIRKTFPTLPQVLQVPSL